MKAVSLADKREGEHADYYCSIGEFILAEDMSDNIYDCVVSSYGSLSVLTSLIIVCSHSVMEDVHCHGRGVNMLLISNDDKSLGRCSFERSQRSTSVLRRQTNLDRCTRDDLFQYKSADEEYNYRFPPPSPPSPSRSCL